MKIIIKIITQTIGIFLGYYLFYIVTGHNILKMLGIIK